MGINPQPKTKRNNEIKRLNKEGVSYNDLAKKFDISVQRVHSIIKNYETQSKVKIGDTCYFCGITDRLQTHHADGKTFHNKHGNAVTLCEPCHKKFHSLARLFKN